MESIKIQKYPAYKDSGVEWLGEIPEHWEALPSKRFHVVKKQSNSKRECENVLSLTLRGVVNNNPDSPEGMVPKDYGTYQIFEKDNLVFKLIDLENVKTSRVGIVHEKGIMSSAYIRLIVGQDNYPRYTFYYFYCLYINEVYNNLGSGVRSTLGPNDLLNIPYIKPRIAEQTAIAEFLDRKTALIDQAIGIKEKQIELLKERRQILIHRAVTRGLNPDVKLKVSGVEWIGEIPGHWEATKLGYIAFIGNGSTPNRGNLRYWEDGIIPWLNSSKVNDKIITTAEQFITTTALKECHLPMLTPGTLVIAITGEGKTRGMCAICNIETTINQHLAYIKVDEIKIEATFLLQYLQAMYINIRADSSGLGSTKGAITCQSIKKFNIPIPPKSEQLLIIEYVENVNNKIVTAISLKEQEIEKLKEYKTSLINEVVTGKIKVDR